MADLFSDIPDVPDMPYGPDVWGDPNEPDAWKERAYRMVCQFAVMHRGESYLMEVVRVWAESNGLPIPNDKRSWGSITDTAKRNGVIIANGVGPAKSSRGGMKTVWKMVGGES